MLPEPWRAALRRQASRWPFVTAALVALVFLACLLVSTDGHFVPQVVDLYVVCQYAQAAAAGHPFQYNAGEPASSGATSLLHTLLLAAAHALGARGEGLVAFAIALGAGLYFVSVGLAGRLGRLLAADEDHDGQREGRLAAVLVALGGPVVWGFFYGSDIALFLMLALLLAVKWVEGWDSGRAAGWVTAAALLALARPEGLPLAVLLGLVWTLARGGGLRRKRWLVWVPALTGAAVLLLQRVVTGAWLSSSIADKSLFANYGVRDGLALLSEYVVDVLRGLLLGFYPSQTPVGFARGWAALYFPPLGLLLVTVALARPAVRVAGGVRTWVAVAAAVALLLAPNVFMGVHFNRYVLWALPTLLVLVAVGLAGLTRAVAGGDASFERTLFRVLAGGLVALGLVSTLRFATIYGEMAGEVWRRDVQAAEWIRRHLPAGVGIANVATSVEYLTGHRNVNLHGVTSPAFFGNTKAEREAGTFEALGRLSPAERPEYLLTSVAMQEGHVSLRALAAGEALFRSLSFGDELLLYRLRWEVAERNRAFRLPQTAAAVAGLREVDRLNVGDTHDERAHGYTFRSALGDVALHAGVRVAAYGGAPEEPVVDAGRVILGREAFVVRTQRGRDLVVVLRTAGDAAAGMLRAAGSGVVNVEVQEAALTLRAGGEVALRASLRPAAGWDEWVLRVPAEHVGDGSTRVEVSGRYASFFYWFYQ